MAGHKKRKYKPPRTPDQFFALPKKLQRSLENGAHTLSTMRSKGWSLRKASLEFEISPPTVKRIAGAALYKDASGRYKARVRDTIPRVLVLPQSGGLSEVLTRDSRWATLAHDFLEAAQLFEQTGDDSELERFRDLYIVNAEGSHVRFLTDLDELERLGSAGVLSFESMYARVG